jgi:hypothetical protein
MRGIWSETYVFGHGFDSAMGVSVMSLCDLLVINKLCMGTAKTYREWRRLMANGPWEVAWKSPRSIRVLSGEALSPTTFFCSPTCRHTQDSSAKQAPNANCLRLSTADYSVIQQTPHSIKSHMALHGEIRSTSARYLHFAV